MKSKFQLTVHTQCKFNYLINCQQKLQFYVYLHNSHVPAPYPVEVIKKEPYIVEKPVQYPVHYFNRREIEIRFSVPGSEFPLMRLKDGEAEKVINQLGILESLGVKEMLSGPSEALKIGA